MKRLIFSIIVSSMVFSLVPTSVFATSIYDNTIQLTDSLYVDNATCEQKDLSKTWINDIWLNPAVDYQSAPARQALWDLTAEHWGTGIVKSGDDTFVYIYMTDNTDVTTRFDAYVNNTITVASVLSTSGNNQWLLLRLNDDCSTYTPISTSGGSQSSMSWTISSPYDGYYIFLSTSPVTYPTGYEGDQIPDTYTPPVTATDYAPKFAVNVQVRKLTIIPCINPTQCPSLPPGFDNTIGMTIKVLDSDGAILFTKSGMGRDLQLTEFEVSAYGDYTVTVSYYAPIPYIQPENQTWNTTSLPIEVNGNTFVYGTGKGLGECNEQGNCSEFTQTLECLSFSPLSLNIAGCVRNMATIVNLLSFGAITVPVIGNMNDACHELTVLGDWIHVTNKYVCPAVPKPVRDTVTPVVTALLGLTMLTFVVNKRNEGYGT